MIKLTDDGSRALSDIAARHHISQGAVEHLFMAVVAGQGYQAQFNHPELGGMGQWSSGGMTMIGDMFNGNLKGKVADICAELAELSRNTDLWQEQSSAAPTEGGGASLSRQSTTTGNWWPDNLGHVSSTGAQNDLRYAVFPSTQRLAVSLGGHIKIYDTGDHRISGFSQQQGSEQSVAFTSQHGLVRVADLQEVTPPGHSRPVAQEPVATPAHAPAPNAPTEKPAPSSEHDIFAKIERLADLHSKGVLRDEEFDAKKRELLDRL